MLKSTDPTRQLHAMRLVACVLESVLYTPADLQAEGAAVETVIPVGGMACQLRAQHATLRLRPTPPR